MVQLHASALRHRMPDCISLDGLVGSACATKSSRLKPLLQGLSLLTAGAAGGGVEDLGDARERLRQPRPVAARGIAPGVFEFALALLPAAAGGLVGEARSEARRVGKEGGRTGGERWWRPG